MQSILTQSFSDFELFLLDDASNDGSESFLAEYRSHPRVAECILNAENSGNPCLQWQKGLSLARGKYVWIAESDDSSDAKFLEVLVNLLEREPQANLAYCRSVEIDDAGKASEHDYFWPDALSPDRWKHSFTTEGDTEFSNYMAFRNIIPNASSVLFRRLDKIDKILPRDFRYCGDWVFWSRLMVGSRICFDSRGLNRFRHHSQSTRATGIKEKERKRCEEYLRVLEVLNVTPKWYPQNDCRDHSWICESVLDRLEGIPWFLLTQRSISKSLRLSFVLGTLRQFTRWKMRRIKESVTTRLQGK